MALNAITLRRKNRIVPGGVTVTYKQQNSGVGVTVQRARKRPLSFTERMVSTFRENVVDCNWMLPTETLGGIVPVPGDSITDPADPTHAWIVERVDSALMEQEYKLYAVRTR